MSESTFNDSSVGIVGFRVVAYSRQYKRTNERKGTSYSTFFSGDCLGGLCFNIFVKRCLKNGNRII
jgi:hypothetical protein